eukprot:7539609-Prorocentrum_lima.AAC.1
MDFLMKGPMKEKLPEWWAKGTSEARLIAAGVDLSQNGFICTTSQFERLRQKSIDDDKLLKICGKRLC